MTLRPDLIRGHLIDAARERRTMTYGELIALLDREFTTNLVGQLGKALDRIDDYAVANGEPMLAVLVVRLSDRLPGQGWWTTRADAAGYRGSWTGPDALSHVTELQNHAFDYWQHH